jgi:dGTPase
MKDHGGFNHNTQSFRVVTLLEEQYPNFKGLNLTYETREGMLKHETDYDKSDASGYAPDKRASLEAQIANLADETAYNAHDLEDGLRAGLFHPEDLDELILWQELKEAVGWSNGRAFTPIIRRELIRELIGQSMSNILENTTTNLVAYKIDTPQKVQTHPDNLVDYVADFGIKVRQLKQFLYQRMYRHYRLMRMQTKAERFITEIFNAYTKEPKMLPTKIQGKLNEAPLPRVITDYIAGMTDRYALQEWQKLFDPYEPA